MTFEQLVTDKKVLIIGPAPYLVNKSILHKIDKYDTIVRLNRSVEMLEELSIYTGNKIDVLYHCIDINPEQGNHEYSVKSWKQKGVKHVRIPYPPVTQYYLNNIKIYDRNNAGILESSIVNPNTYIKIFQGCNNTSPNTGTIAVLDILENKPKALHISGLTFLKGKKIYMDGYRDRTNSEDLIRKQNAIHKNHSIDFQVDFLKKELKKYDNITYDEEVEEILRNK